MSADDRPDTPSRGEETDDVLAKLVRDARGGDERSFARLAGRVRARIYRWALAGTGDPDEAEDVAQEVLLRLHRYLAGFEGRSRFDTWLYRITANAASTARSRAGARGGVSRPGQHGSAEARPGGLPSTPAGLPADPPIDPQHEDAEASLDRRLDAGRVAELVHLYFQRLPTRQREVFDLVDLQGYAPREVAEMMQMNPTTVRAHLFKARRAIRGHILREHAKRVEGWA